MLVPKTEVIVTKDGQQCARYVVEPGDYVIGREPGCEIIVDADLVSRRHAQLTVNYSEWLIQDLQSSNGTLVNGNAVTECVKVWPNQKIQVGSATIELRRVKEQSSGDHSMAPSAAALKRVLPEEFLRDKKYDIGGIVAQGGMGAILNAKDATTERTVAMKVMLNGNSEDDMLRFIGEAKVTAQLEHPNVVPLYELSVDEHEQPFYTMKFVKGVTLRSILEKIRDGDAEMIKAYPLTLLLTIFQKVCDALAFAHSKGIVHRDLKPENVMIGDYGEVLVMDWGLAKVLGKADPNTMGARSAVMTAVHSAPDASHTMAGAIMGTPNFMAPEQAAGEVDKMDARTDIFSLGGILYNILTLRPPFTGESVNEILEKVLEARVTRPSAFNKKAVIETSDGKKIRPFHCPGSIIPDALSAVAMKALALKPLDRYQNVQALQKDITAYQTGFATSAENAGVLKQMTLLVKRHKAIFTTAFAAWLIITALAVWFVLNLKAGERRAVASEGRATTALDNLRKTAPNMLALAVSEATFQRFDSALDKISAALALDQSLTSAYWRRGWILLAQEKLPESLNALREAQTKDTANRQFAEIIPLVETMIASPEAARHSTEIVRPIYKHLAEAGATGESTPFIRYLKQSRSEDRNLVQQRLEQWLGKPRPGEKDGYSAVLNSSNDLIVSINGLHVATLAPLRGLPIDQIHAIGCGVTSLSPLRGMRLTYLEMDNNPIKDLSPLKGMPLDYLYLSTTRVTDISLLTGMKLKKLYLDDCNVTDLRSLSGMPLEALGLSNCPATDFSPLRGLPLRQIDLRHTQFSDGRILSGMPLATLVADNTRLTDLSPLTSVPLKELSLRYPVSPVSDYTPLLRVTTLEFLNTTGDIKTLLPLRNHPGLREINWNDTGFRPAADFWRDCDARQPAQKK